MADEPITSAMLSYYTGIDESRINSLIRGRTFKDSYGRVRTTHGYRGIGLQAGTLRYRKDYGFLATTNPNGAGKTHTVRFYIVVGQSGQDGYFGDDAEIEEVAEQIRAGKKKIGSPPMDADNVIIPLKDDQIRERRFTNQEIVRLKGQVQYGAVSPEQRPLVKYMREHPNATLAQFNAYQRGRRKK